MQGKFYSIFFMLTNISAITHCMESNFTTLTEELNKLLNNQQKQIKNTDEFINLLDAHKKRLTTLKKKYEQEVNNSPDKPQVITLITLFLRVIHLVIEENKNTHAHLEQNKLHLLTCIGLAYAENEQTN